MALDALVSVDRMRVDVVARSKKHALEMAADLLASAYRDLSGNDIFDALAAREKLGCTSLDHGVALPHAAFKSVDSGAIAVLKLREPVAFGGDDRPVGLIFAMVLPALRQGADNDILQQACDLLTQGEYRRALTEAGTPIQLYNVVRGESLSANIRQASG
jgi:PTS system nitrogen regulatory IIA component